MRVPKEKEIWILNNERFDPKTGGSLAPLDLKVRVEQIEPAHVRKSVDRETGKESSIRVPDRVFFRYCENDTNEALGLRHESGKMRLGSYELTLFQQRARPDG